MNAKLFRHIFSTISLLIVTPLRFLHGQDVEAVINAPPLTANGGIAFSQIFNAAGGSGNVPNPYSYFITGNINFNSFGVVNIPLSFSFSNQQFTGRASLPFNRFSIAPSYKWVKVYAGFTSLQFSPYTLAGHEIFGGGVELTPPGKFRFTAIYGRLKKAEDEQYDMPPVYKRMGGGFKAEYSGNTIDAGVNIFKATDDVKSLVLINPDSLSVMPQDNLSGSVYLSATITEKIRFISEYGVSVVNRNAIYDSGSFLFDLNGDIAVYHAINHNLVYSTSIGNIGASYERIAPNYSTAGAYYMTNDFENITANVSTAIKNVNIAINGGFQRDDLEKQKNVATSRIIFSSAVSTPIGQKWNVGANMSNVQSYTHIRDIYKQITQTNEFQNLDTLEYTQINLATGANLAYQLQNSERQNQSISANFNYQRAAEHQRYSSRQQGNNIYNGALIYLFSHIPAKWNLSASVSYNYNQMPENYTGTASYSLSFQKNFWEVLRGMIGATYSNMSGSAVNATNILNVRITGGYTLLKKHNFSLTAAAVSANAQNQKNLTYTANIAYGYSFGMTIARKDSY